MPSSPIAAENEPESESGPSLTQQLHATNPFAQPEPEPLVVDMAVSTNPFASALNVLRSPLVAIYEESVDAVQVTELTSEPCSPPTLSSPRGSKDIIAHPFEEPVQPSSEPTSSSLFVKDTDHTESSTSAASDNRTVQSNVPFSVGVAGQSLVSLAAEPQALQPTSYVCC
jgi:hypothetical protein